jgi:N-acetylmuramic acid 6-phosphate etherase
MVGYLTGSSDENAREALERTDGNVKLSVMLLYGSDLESARSALERTGGRLRQALDLVGVSKADKRNRGRRNGKVRRALV